MMMNPMDEDQVSKVIIGCAIEVHRELRTIRREEVRTQMLNAKTHSRKEFFPQKNLCAFAPWRLCVIPFAPSPL
jgi:hypothetical protein